MTRIHWRTGEDFGPAYVSDRGAPTRYRSVRNAGANIYDAMTAMDYLSRADYRVEIEVIATGERKAMPEGLVDEITEYNRRDSYDNSIGARLGRGETVVV